MASIEKYDKGIVVRWDKDDWIKGLASVYGAGTAGTASRPADGMISLAATNPFRRFGFLSPGFPASAATNSSVIAAVIRNGVAHGNNIYAIEGGAKLHEITNLITPTVTTPTTFPHTITPHGHSAAVGSDIIAYYLDGTKYIFYSWNDNTDGDVGRYDFATTFDDDYVSTAATSGAVLSKDYNHPMIVGDDNILYVGNGKDLASLQGTTAAGIWNPSALDLPEGYEIQSYSKTGNFLVIYANYEPDPSNTLSDTIRADSVAFFWDYVSDSFTYAIPLQGSVVDAGFSLNGIPGCFVQGQSEQVSSESKILLYNGSSFETLTHFDEDLPIHGGVEVTGSLIKWNSKGKMMSYGSAYQGQDASLQKLATGSGTTSGMLRTFTDVALPTTVMSSGATTSGGYEIFKSAYSESALAQTGQKQLPTSGRGGWQIDFVKVSYFAKVSTGTRFDLSIVTDSSFAAPDVRGGETYIYESPSGGPASITQISNLYSTPSQTSSPGTFPLIQSSLGVKMNWTGGSGTSTGDAPCVEYVEVYLSPNFTINEQ